MSEVIEQLRHYFININIQIYFILIVIITIVNIGYNNPQFIHSDSDNKLHHSDELVSNTHSIFWDNLTDNDMINFINKIELDLKIFIYPIPDISIHHSSFGLRDIDLSHFMSEFIFIDHLKFLHKHSELLGYTNLSHLVVDNPDMANIFIIDHEWTKVARRKCNILYSEYLGAIINNVVDNYPFYNRSGGFDHFFFAVYDTGPFCDPMCDNGTNKAILKRIMNSTFIGNYGMDKETFKNTLAMTNKNYIITTDCHRSGYDIVIPQLLKPESIDFFHIYSKSKYPNRFNDTSFSGSEWYDRWPLIYMCKDAREDYYNNSLERFDCFLSGDTNPDLIYHGYFMYNPCGFACWSQRLFESLAHYTIPILINDGAIQPFEKFIDWTKFTVKINRYTWFNNDFRNQFRKILRKESHKFRLYYHKCLISNHLSITPPEFITTLIVNDTYDSIWLNSNHSACLHLFNSFIFKKTAYIPQAINWLNFLDLSKSINAFKLLEFEIWCRIYKYYDFNSNDPNKYFHKMSRLCDRPSDYTGRKEYFYDIKSNR